MAILSSYELLTAFSCVVVLYIPVLVFYRLYLSPLAKFPGPKLAAATLWYEFYYDVIKRGRYTWKIKELHDQYGPIIRISPYELHIDDPDYYDEIYVGSSRRTLKYEWSVRGFGPLLYAFSSISHELHRTRRGALAPFFSKSLVQQLEPAVQAMVDKLVSRLQTLRGTGTIVNLINVFPCLTSDVICQYAFASPYGYLDAPEFAPTWHKAVMEASEASHFFKHFAWMEKMMRTIPTSIVKKMAPTLGSLFLMSDMVRDKILKVQKDLSENKKIEGQKTIFHDLLTSDQLPPQEKTPVRLEFEGVGLVAAGSMTVAHTLSVISYHVLANPEILRKLQEELDGVSLNSDSPPRWSQLEQLSYLTAVITEGLRWGHGVSHRLQRISPDTDLQYKEYSIPRGTPVGMTSILIHNNPTIFPQAQTFSPERWLQPNASQLRKYLVAFSKGSRQCLGMNLAYCELYLTLFAIFKRDRFNFELYETGVRDAEVYHDFFNACTRLDSKGIRVRVE